jgi:protein transport protein SEC13
MEGIDSRLILSLHEGMIHDAKFDYSGKRLSTAGSDGVINVFDLAHMKRASTLTFHKRAIWQLKWAHPKFGDPILASLDCDGAVCISQECPPGTWK